MARLFALAFSCLLVFSCAATKLVTVQSREEVIVEPTIGEERLAEVGDSLVRTAKVTRLPALQLQDEVEASGTGWAWGNKAVFKPGLYVSKYNDGKQECFESLAPVPVRSLGWAEGRGGICISKANPNSMTLYMGIPGQNAIYKPRGSIKVTHTTHVDKDAPGFWQELIYNGKSGDSVKFLYREFASGMARPAFDQGVQYDLKEGKVVGFKGARVEVIEATNVNLRYRVLTHFPLPAQQ